MEQNIQRTISKSLQFVSIPHFGNIPIAVLKHTAKHEQTIQETVHISQPSHFKFITFKLTDEAMSLLTGTPENRHRDKAANLTLFYDLLSRMAVRPKVLNDFRRPLN